MGIKERQDLHVLAGSIIFLGGIIGGIFGWGGTKGWSAEKPIVWPDQDRFWPKPNATNCSNFDPLYEAPVRHVEKDCYSRWYYWQLPQDQADAVSRVVVWVLYALHQIGHWVLIWFAQQHKKEMLENKEEVYVSKLRWYNWALVGVTWLFHILHLVQTHTTYDATAKDVVIQASQGSVIMMLVFILLIEYRDRGLVFGWPNQWSDDAVAKKLRLTPEPIEYVRKYHGYAFSWAVIFTFWYHPMENTYGHVLGFCHTFLVMIQGSLIYQKIHLNKYFRFLLETWVLFHGFAVAVMVAKGEWWDEMAPFMFGIGFGTLVFVTQLYGLPFWRGLNPYFRLIPGVLWIVAVVIGITASSLPNSYILTMFQIPLGQIGCAVIAWFICWLLMKCLTPRQRFSNIVFAISTLSIYCIFIAVSALFQYYAQSIEVPFIAMTYILVFLYMIGAIFAFFLAPVPENLLTDSSKVSPGAPLQHKLSTD